MTEPKDTKPRTGTIVKTKLGLWQPVVTLRDGTRKRLKPFKKGTSEAMAREKTTVYAQDAYRLGLKRPEKKKAIKPADSCEAWFTAWTADRLARGYTSTDDSAGHFRKYVVPSIGDKHIRDWTAADMRKLCRDLDTAVIAGKLAWKTAVNVRSTATRMCDDACGSKIEELRVRDDNPAHGVRAPDRGASKAKQFLYPSEALALMLCAAVPLLWRRLLAVAIYTYTREAELRALDWSDIDFEHGVIHIHTARNRRTGDITATKGMQNRRIPIDPALLPLLVAMHAEAEGKGLLFPIYPVAHHSAIGLRAWLKKAQIKRAELFRNSPTHKRMTLHDLRATGITWLAIRGDDPLKIQQRAGHTDFKTTQRYVRTAETVAGEFGKPFPELPPVLLEQVPAVDSLHPIDHQWLTMRNYLASPGCVPGDRSVSAAGSSSSTTRVATPLSTECSLKPKRS